ncbi:hydroxylysine kinase-like isoform X1 [Mytilus trossulus]|uniref:hydroxylysine kinase-like isoform X1 n=1 Tax=Mytilus trossulus TaxID=6551 RepID=UPI003004BC57
MDVQKDIRPTADDVISLLKTNLDCTVSHVEELKAYEDRNFYLKIVESEQNQCDYIGNVTEFVVKMTNCEEMSELKWKSLQKILNCLLLNGFTCTKLLTSFKMEKNGKEYLVLLLNYIPGSPLMYHWSKLNKTTVIKQVGEMVADLHNTLQTLDPSLLDVEMNKEDAWVLENARVMLGYLIAIKDENEREIIESIIKQFINLMEQNEEHFTRGLVHGDLHDMNLIVNWKDGQLQPHYNASGNYTVKDLFGIIDFGDMCVSCYIYEVGQIIRDLMVSTCPDNCYSVAVTFLSGYLKCRKLNQHELSILFLSIMTALCQYYVISEYKFHGQSDNEYVKEGAKEACQLIKAFHSMSDIFMSNLSKFLQSEFNIDLIQST